MGSYPHYLRKQTAYKYTLRVSLKGAPTPIWRKFEVPSNISLRHLSELILRLFGWDGYHLNCFFVQGMQICPKEQITDSFFMDDRQIPQEKYSIQNILTYKGDKVTFEYDFGDSWDHIVTLSSFEEYAEGEKPQVVFKNGKGACPPEDCGGVWGYKELLDSLARKREGDRLDEEDEGFLEWANFDDDFDPEYIDKEECEIICKMFSR